jgi:hypothetical protein
VLSELLAREVPTAAAASSSPTAVDGELRLVCEASNPNEALRKRCIR